MAWISLNDNQTNTNKVLLCISFCLLVLRSYQFFWTVPWFPLRDHPLLCWQGKRSGAVFLYETGRIQSFSAFFSQQMDVWQSLGVLSWTNLRAQKVCLAIIRYEEQLLWHIGLAVLAPVCLMVFLISWPLAVPGLLCGTKSVLPGFCWSYEAVYICFLLSQH